jgi:uncharacterized protein YjbI with pentapeptide repeats
MKKRSEPSFSVIPEKTSFNGEILRHDQEWYEKETITGEIIDHSFSGCRFDHVTLPESMESCGYTDCLFVHCDFSNCRMQESAFRRCAFEDCRLIGTDLEDSFFEDIRFQHCSMRYASFGASRWKRGAILSSECSECSFTSCTFADMELSEDLFEQAEFGGCRLAGMDFSTCSISGMLVSTVDLKGIIVNEEQAVVLAELLGIHVKHDSRNMLG